ncbi:MAG: hypothetical protein CMI30_05805 [Opitutae bacterium]|nr:hypothetical protein [Opitutae bacterium]
MKTIIALLALFISTSLFAKEPKFRQQEIDSEVGVGYGLQLADMNGDGKTDVVLVDKDKVAWYQNPSWKKHQVSGHLTQRDHVCVTARDIDGDGKAELAVGGQWNPGDTVNSGAVFYLSPTPDRSGNWKPVKLYHEPTTHRMHWVKNPAGKFDLVVKPLYGRGNKGGRGDPLKMHAYHLPKNLEKDEWKTSLVSEFLHNSHNFHPVNWDKDQEEELLVTGVEGTWLLDRKKDNTWSRKQIAKPFGGEVRDGKLPDGRRFVATVEPRHGSVVACYVADGKKWTRHVLDTTFKDGHALATADFLGLGGQQIVAGWRGMNPRAVPGVKLFVPLDKDYTKWKTYQLSGAEIAVEDIKAGDLNGDGKPEIIVAGRQTHNLKIFWNDS